MANAALERLPTTLVTRGQVAASEAHIPGGLEWKRLADGVNAGADVKQPDSCQARGSVCSHRCPETQHPSCLRRHRVDQEAGNNSRRHCREAPRRGHLSYPQCDWLVLECPAAASWCAGVTGADGHQRARLHSSICVAMARGGMSSAEPWREAATWLRFPCALVGQRRGGRKGREGR